MNYDEYVKSGVWKCEKSPTGAHFWTVGPGEHDQTRMHCTYCGKVKRFCESVEKKKAPKVDVRPDVPYPTFPGESLNHSKEPRWES